MVTSADLASIPDLEVRLKEFVPLVRSIAQKLMVTLPASIDRNDLIQVGMIGVCEAMIKFDPSAGASLSTYASIRAKGAMQDELRRLDHLSRGHRDSYEGGDMHVVIDDAHDVAAPPPDSVYALLAEDFDTLDSRLRNILARRLRGDAIIDIAADLGVTESRVSQLVRAGAKKVRTNLYKRRAITRSRFMSTI